MCVCCCADIFQRFSPKEEHEKFISELHQEMQLRKKVAQLQNYRRLGIRTHAEIDQYDRDLKSRQDELRSRCFSSLLFVEKRDETSSV